MKYKVIMKNKVKCANFENIYVNESRY